jgi:hypothetical protein
LGCGTVGKQGIVGFAFAQVEGLIFFIYIDNSIHGFDFDNYILDFLNISFMHIARLCFVSAFLLLILLVLGAICTLNDRV